MTIGNHEHAEVTTKASVDSTPAVSRATEPESLTPRSLDPTFKLVFFSVLGLTVLSLLLHVALVITLAEPNDQAKLLIETCSTLTKTGFGAMVGLIGGKVL